MRTKVIIISTFLLLLSCGKKIEPEKLLIGSWKIRDVIDQTEQNFSQKTTFDSDSLVVEMFAGKKLTDRISAKYRFDKASNTIHYELMKIKIDLKVLKLTDKEMELLNIKEKKTYRFIRIE